MRAEVTLSDELVEKVFAYVEREVGRDAPLSLEDEALVQEMLATRPDVRAMADELRALDTSLNTLFNDVDDVDVPDHIVQLIHDHTEKGATATDQQPAKRDEINIVDFQQAKEARRRFGYGSLATAASVAAMICSAAFFQVYKTVDADRSQLTAELTVAANILKDGERALVQSEEQMKQLRNEQSVLQQRYEALIEDKERLDGLAHDRDRVAAELADAKRSLEIRISDHELGRTLQAKVAELAADLTDREGQLANLADEHRTLESEKAEIQQQLGDLEKTLASKEEEAGALKNEQKQLALEVSKERQQVAALKGELDAALSEITTLNQTASLLLEDRDQLHKKASWVNQVIGYHRGYAGTMREVEVTAEQEQKNKMLTKWLGKMLGQEFSVPDLSNVGMSFIGGRVYFVDGRPTGQIAYHDAQGQLVGFCFTPAQNSAESALKLGQDADLNLGYWQKNGFEFAMVGWTDLGLLSLVAEHLQKNYGEEI